MNDSLAIQQFVTAQKIRQESGSFERTERPVLSKVEWAPGIFFSENNGLQYLVWIRKIIPPSLRTFDEARPSIISDYQTFLEKQWIVALKKEHPVKVNKKAKQTVLQQLVNNGS
jgi:peptidyl-prolyl cis-trans isomerase SurA